MLRKIAFIYPWATHGGVEKVMLTRAKLLNDTGIYQIDVLFTHDSGAAKAINSALSDCKNVNVKIVSLNYLQEQNYHYIFCIDFPAALEFCHTKKLKYFAECHTPYKDNRAYLSNIPESCSAILCPSNLFMEQLEPELKKVPCQLSLLRNFVPWDHVSHDADSIPTLPRWSRRPILFLGRMDKLKNPLELLDAFVSLKARHPEKYMLLLCGPQSSEIDINTELASRGLIGDAVVLPPVPFLKVDKLLIAVSKANGIFISPSTGESFGLSASEAICSDIPVVLSDIEAHRYLVAPREKEFTYPLHGARQLSEKIEFISENYANSKVSLSELKDKFSAHAFMSDWDELLRRH
ncbi:MULTISPECIES: glycosyltransferase family 4 protein [Serratia]|uniref:glycosyltransferase family 4 protein n=1 Tax=Serratia TaxID=613 RepID=UPI000745022B|nr:glycosyltransferase family 4 protein [Serratia marcescens]CUZ34458.1 D-inositol-3-phosphate glycosyltransferase [Serratia marcescens]CUZ64433.1 D-inositol-3-phosphate glycosyltransferase [Serratia marcescens]CVB63654.1 D-inositol-3-phosphate glycosyltransferase [Serratia marcescens]CVB81318.1 D-inositol-3-phosphate glycosyltransferase [Serratia marcescens]CVD22324.1 D-inositol-3-phosphate glycosyltransferase [Serratia marcescens]